MSELKEFLSMGGYGFYVWSSYGLCLIVLVLNVLFALGSEKTRLNSISKRKNISTVEQ